MYCTQGIHSESAIMNGFNKIRLLTRPIEHQLVNASDLSRSSVTATVQVEADGFMSRWWA